MATDEIRVGSKNDDADDVQVEITIGQIDDVAVQQGDEMEPIQVQATVNGEPHANLDFSLEGLPGGVTFEAETRQISGVPTEAGEFTVSVQAQDQVGNVDELTFTLTVTPTEAVEPPESSEPADPSDSAEPDESANPTEPAEPNDPAEPSEVLELSVDPVEGPSGSEIVLSGLESLVGTTVDVWLHSDPEKIGDGVTVDHELVLCPVGADDVVDSDEDKIMGIAEFTVTTESEPTASITPGLK